MFIKLGKYRFNFDDIACIKVLPSGCVVYLRSGVTISVTDVNDEDLEIIENHTISKRGEPKPTYLTEVEK